MNPALLKRLNQTRYARRAVIVVTDTTTGEERLVEEADRDERDPLAGELVQRFRSGASGLARTTGAEANLLTVYLPAPRLIIIGAVHISQALAPMARLTGFDVTIVDPRTAFATPARFPDTVIRPVWPVDAFVDHPLDPYTALAALTHDPKIDDSALNAALAAGCFYVGALGSRKTHARRRERLGEAGLDEASLDRVNAPIGLDIRARSPAEIAVAVLAEIVATLRSRSLESD
ncbi:MAG: XdhC family protein [Alphaproteobacteria bacterium]